MVFSKAEYQGGHLSIGAALRSDCITTCYRAGAVTKRQEVAYKFVFKQKGYLMKIIGLYKICRYITKQFG